MSEESAGGRQWRRVTIEAYLTDEEYASWNRETTSALTRITDYEELQVDHRRETKWLPRLASRIRDFLTLEDDSDV